MGEFSLLMMVVKIGFLFKYERKPNLCYWCGCLTHADKDCDLWLNNKGTLSVENQQFGSWLRAPPFVPLKKSMVHVPRFYEKKIAARLSGSSVFFGKASPMVAKPILESSLT